MSKIAMKSLTNFREKLGFSLFLWDNIQGLFIQKFFGQDFKSLENGFQRKFKQKEKRNRGEKLVYNLLLNKNWLINLNI